MNVFDVLMVGSLAVILMLSTFILIRLLIYRAENADYPSKPTMRVNLLDDKTKEKVKAKTSSLVTYAGKRWCHIPINSTNTLSSLQVQRPKEYVWYDTEKNQLLLTLFNDEQINARFDFFFVGEL